MRTSNICFGHFLRGTWVSVTLVWLGAQLREAEGLRLKGKLGTAGSGSGGSRKFSASFLRQLSLQPSGSTWQVGRSGPCRK